MKINQQNVWLSTRKHEETFARIYKENSWFRKIIGVYKIPKGFPYLGGWMIMIPLIHEHKCSISIDEDQISFVPNRDFNSYQFRNIGVDFNLNIPMNSIQKVEIHQTPKVPMSLFNGTNWIRLVFINDADLEQEILFCEDAKTKSNRNVITLRLFNIIKKHLDKQAQPHSDTKH